MTDVRHLPRNSTGHDYVVGDVHGCMDELRQRLRDISFDYASDRLFCVGDLIDRGPKSVEALQLLDEPWFYSVVGNHEQLMIRSILYRDATAFDIWLSNGGLWYFDVDADFLTAWAQRLTQLPYAITVGEGKDRFNVIHAEFFGNDELLDAGSWSDDVKQQMLWGRSLASGKAPPNCQEGLSQTYCGHTIVKNITRRQRQVFIDTGACLSYVSKSNGATGSLSIVKAATAI